MKILLVTHYFSTHRGGVEIVAGHVATEAAKHSRAHVTWLASDCDSAPELGTGNIRCVPIPAWNSIERRFGIPFPIWGLVGVRRIWQESKQAECIHLHDALYPGNMIAFVVGKMRHIPVVVTQHIGFIAYDSLGLRNLLSLLNHTVARIVLSRASQVVFISAGVQRYFSHFCRFSRPPLYIPNGVDTARFVPLDLASRRRLRNRMGIAAGHSAFLFVGRFVEKKGLSILRDLAAAYPDDLWMVAGHGPINPESWALPNLRVIRNAAGSQLVELYQVADLLVLPSRGEGFPLVVQESMACGTPALVGPDSAAGCPAATDLLLVENVGTPDTASRWRERIRQVKQRPRDIEAMRPKVAAFAREQWSWESCGRAYADVFRECLSGRTGRPIS